MSGQKPVGWITPTGQLFPLSAYNKANPSPYDAHKADWEPVYRGEKRAPVDTSAALAAVQSFARGIPELAKETT